MENVQPIKDLEALERMKAILRRRSYRDYIMLLLGCNTALRVGDLLGLSVGDVRGDDENIRSHIVIREDKTGKQRRAKLPEHVREELGVYCSGLPDAAPLLPSRKGGKAITPVQAWRILHGAAAEAGLDEIGTHSMRKTWGYHAYQRTHDVAIVQHSLNHSSPAVTRRYLGIDDDEVDKALDGFEL